MLPRSRHVVFELNQALKKWLLALFWILVVFEGPFLITSAFGALLTTLFKAPVGKALLFLGLLVPLESGIYLLQGLAPVFLLPVFALWTIERGGRRKWVAAVGLVALAAWLTTFLYDHFMDAYPWISLDDTTPYQYGITVPRYLLALVVHALVITVAVHIKTSKGLLSRREG